MLPSWPSTAGYISQGLPPIESSHGNSFSPARLFPAETLSPAYSVPALERDSPQSARSSTHEYRCRDSFRPGKSTSQPKKVPSAIRKQVVERSAVMLPAAASITSGSTVEETRRLRISRCFLPTRLVCVKIAGYRHASSHSVE